MPHFAAPVKINLAYAESRTAYTAANELTWNRPTGLSITVTIPSNGIVRLRTRGSWTISTTDKSVVVVRIYDDTAGAEVGRGKLQFPHLGTAAGSPEAYGGLAEAECRLTGLTPGASKTYVTEFLQIADATNPTVQFDGDSGADKNAHHIEAFAEIS